MKPQCALRIGVVGNRHIDPAVRAEAKAALATVWTTLLESIEDVHAETRSLFSNDLPRVAVLSSLAAGGDQIGAQAAFDVEPPLAAKFSIELELILPFREEHYPAQNEFTADDVTEFERLQTAATHVVRLDGDYSTEETRAEAYQRTRDLLIQNSDLIVAIYDPFATPGKAGTVETVRRAVEGHTPVIAVLLHGGEARIAILAHTADLAAARDTRWQRSSAIDSEVWRRQAFERVREQLILPEALQRNKRALRIAVERLEVLGGSRALPRLCRSADILSRVWEGLQTFARMAADRAKRDHWDPPESTDATFSLSPYDTFFTEADRLSRTAMSTYRGAFVISYLLAGFAVAAAVAMLAATALWEEDVPTFLIVILGGAKLTILGLLVLIESTNHHGRHHEIAADFRYLAELLRPMQWLAPIGAYPPPVELPLHASAHNHGRTWITWLARAITRTAPSVVPVDGRRTVLLDADAAADALDAARKEWIAGQAQYHGLRARAMHDLESGLENYARGLLWAVILLAFGAMTLEVLMKQHLLPHGAHTYAAVMGAAAAILPAFMAAFHGLAFQSEAKRLAVRYGAMHEALVAQYTQIGRDVDDLRRTKPADAVTRVRTVLRNIAADTIREASDWKVFYPVHAIHAG